MSGRWFACSDLDLFPDLDDATLATHRGLDGLLAWLRHTHQLGPRAARRALDPTPPGPSAPPDQLVDLDQLHPPRSSP